MIPLNVLSTIVGYWARAHLYYWMERDLNWAETNYNLTYWCRWLSQNVTICFVGLVFNGTLTLGIESALAAVYHLVKMMCEMCTSDGFSEGIGAAQVFSILFCCLLRGWASFLELTASRQIVYSWLLRLPRLQLERLLSIGTSCLRLGGSLH
jgi:hypothetical protein